LSMFYKDDDPRSLAAFCPCFTKMMIPGPLLPFVHVLQRWWSPGPLLPIVHVLQRWWSLVPCCLLSMFYKDDDPRSLAAFCPCFTKMMILGPLLPFVHVLQRWWSPVPWLKIVHQENVNFLATLIGHPDLFYHVTICKDLQKPLNVSLASFIRSLTNLATGHEQQSPRWWMLTVMGVHRHLIQPIFHRCPRPLKAKAAIFPRRLFSRRLLFSQCDSAF